MMTKTPGRYVMPRNRNRQAVMLWQGQRNKVDAGLESLLTMVNRFQDIAIIASCIGDTYNMGYVEFTGSNRTTVQAFVDRLSVVAEGEPLQIEFHARLNQGCIRWQRRDLNIACRVVSSLLMENVMCPRVYKGRARK